MPNSNTIILGIDPGTNLMGYALISVCGREIRPLEMGVINLKGIKDSYEKMGRILEEMNRLLETHNAQEMAIEAPFYGKNVQSMLKLGRAQGIAIAAALSKGLKVHEYAPRKIKLAITGKGSASKEQVASMLQGMLHFTALPESFDATDALAAAVCHANQNLSSLPNTSRSGSWKDFISKHPELLK